MSSELQGIDKSIDDALAQIPAVEVVAHVTGHFVGLMKELVRRNGHDPEKRIIINAGDQRSITIHKLGEGQEQADAALSDAQQALSTARAMVASLTAERDDARNERDALRCDPSTFVGLILQHMNRTTARGDRGVWEYQALSRLRNEVEHAGRTAARGAGDPPDHHPV